MEVLLFKNFRCLADPVLLLSDSTVKPRAELYSSSSASSSDSEPDDDERSLDDLSSASLSVEFGSCHDLSGLLGLLLFCLELLPLVLSPRLPRAFLS